MKTTKKFVAIFLLAIACGNAHAQWISWSSEAEKYYAETGGFKPGNTTPEVPHPIKEAVELAFLALAINDPITYGDWYADKDYRLANDIDLKGYWTDCFVWDIPIGTSADRPFTGTFDGNRKKIVDMTMDDSFDFAGLFGYTGEGAIIKNLTLDYAVTRVKVRIYGSLIAVARGTTVENCSVTRMDTYGAENLGGFIGEAYNSTIENCSSSGELWYNYNANILPEGYAGGFIGKAAERTKIVNCHFSGWVTFYLGNSKGYAGGFAGVSEAAEFIKCSSEAEVFGDVAGGFIGCIIRTGTGKTTIENCHSTSNTLGRRDYAGGFIASIEPNANVTITGCRASGSVIGQSYSVGGFVGGFRGSGSITDCLADASVLGLIFRVGGFLGNLEPSGETKISGCRATGATDGRGSSVGGFVGDIRSQSNILSVTFCSAEGSVSGYSLVGGFAGYCESSGEVISGCSSYGDVKGGDYVGGFVGLTFSGTVTDSYAVGRVEGKNFGIGGFAGSIDTHGIAFRNCYAVNDVKGNSSVGGFVGTLVRYPHNSTLINCYSAGTVLGIEECGGFAGGVDKNKHTFNNCFYDRQTAVVSVATGTPDVAGITALHTSALTNGVNPGFSESDKDKDKWKFIEGYYPQLTIFNGDKVSDALRLRSGLSVVPLKLANDEETIDDVQNIIHLPKTTPAGDKITWIADPDEDANAWRTLTLRAGKAERTVRFRSTKNPMSCDIKYIIIDNKAIFDIPKQFTHIIPCDSREVSVFAEFILGGNARSNPASPVQLWANTPQTVTVTTNDGETETYTLVAMKPLSSDIFVQRWDDVLAINNNYATNGGYMFTGYEWYKGNTKLPSTKGYIQEPGGLDPKANYWARLTSQHGTIETCPAVIAAMQTKAAVYPNPVQRGQTVRVSPTPALLEREGEAQSGATSPFGGWGAALFDAVGNIVSTQNINVPVAEIVMPDTPGTYILQINGKETFKIVVE